MFFYLLNGFMAVMLVVTIIRIVTELKEAPVHKGRVAGEAVWACVLVLFLLYNFGFLP